MERSEMRRAREPAAGGGDCGGKSGNPHDRIIALNKIKKIINTCLGTMFLSKLSLGDRGQLREVRGRLDLVESGVWGYSRRWQTIEIINFIKIANLDFCEFVEKEQTEELTLKFH